MSEILQEHWEFLSKEHERFLEDPGYRYWLEQQEIKQELLWPNIHPVQQN